MQKKSNLGISTNRFSVSIPRECEAAITKLKRTRYYNRSKSELIRDLIRKGLEAEKRERDEQGK